MAIVKEVNFSAEEGILAEDFTNLQKFLRSQLLDLLGALGTADEEGIAPSVSHAYCLGNGGAPYASATSRRLDHLGGWVFQKISAGDPDGTNPEFLAYYLTENEAATLTSAANTLAVGDATNPRIDILCYKLDHATTDSQARDFKDATTGVVTTGVATDKQRYVRCQMQVVAGTPAGSPTQPSVPAGYVKLCAVYVPATWNAVIDPENIYDYRMPLGLSTETMWAYDAVTCGHYSGADAWTLTSGRAPLALAQNGVNDDCQVHLSPRGNPNRRLLAIGARAGHTGGLPTLTVNDNATALFSTQTLVTNPASYAEESVLASLPIWGNGKRNFYALTRAGTTPSQGGLVYTLDSNLDTLSVYYGRLIFAGGLV